MLGLGPTWSGLLLCSQLYTISKTLSSAPAVDNLCTPARHRETKPWGQKTALKQDGVLEERLVPRSTRGTPGLSRGEPNMVPWERLELSRVSPLASKASMFTNFITTAHLSYNHPFFLKNNNIPINTVAITPTIISNPIGESRPGIWRKFIP